MSVIKVSPFNFRNLRVSNLNLSPEINFLIGDNGSGKSSFLETLFLMGHGKSFRTSSNDHLATHGETNFAVNVQDEHKNSYGLAKDKSGFLTLNINGVKRQRLSEIAQHFAVQVITPESFKLFFGGPKERRKFVNLGLFHVEQSYGNVWRDFNRALKQRNGFLKYLGGSIGNNQKLCENQLNVWNSPFVTLSEELDHFRQNYIDKLDSSLSKLLKIFLPEVGERISLSYSSGWKKGQDLQSVLSTHFDKELQSGFSLYGAQKFDLRFAINRVSIDQILSRGQQKLFLMALTLAQTEIISQHTSQRPILLIDDIGAELDVVSRTKLAQGLSNIGCQVIITAIDEEAIIPLIPSEQEYKKFHVKHGVISELSEG